MLQLKFSKITLEIEKSKQLTVANWYGDLVQYIAWPNKNLKFSYAAFSVPSNNLKGINITRATNIFTARSPNDKVTQGIPVP